MTNNEKLCPFSKPIVGKWCCCEHAILLERCSGKMTCSQSKQYLDSCHELVKQLENNSRFILAIHHKDTPLTHQQAMKIKCGGLQGMQRSLKLGVEKLPAIPEISAMIIDRDGSFANFPYAEIVRDIAAFKHRKPKRKRSLLPNLSTE